MSTRRSDRSGEAGVSAVELALCLPWLMLLTLGMIDYAWYFYVEINAQNAAREGARTATTIPGGCTGTATTAAETVVNTRMGAIGYADKTFVTTSCNTAAGDPQYDVRVEVLFPQLTGYSFIPLPRQGGNVRAVARVSMRGIP